MDDSITKALMMELLEAVDFLDSRYVKTDYVPWAVNSGIKAQFMQETENLGEVGQIEFRTLRSP